MYSRVLIVTLEGASAVGKTTVARALTQLAGSYAVPEVNALFERPKQENASWYLERQAERWHIAEQHSTEHPMVVLDGDVFQTLWYNWTFASAGFQPLEYLVAFFRPLIECGLVGFPDCYVLLLAPEAELRRRKESDPISEKL